MKKTIFRSLLFVLILTMLLGMVTFACADSVPADVDELMELFDDRVSAPKEKSLLNETETMVVQSKHGNSIYVLAKAGGGKKLFTAAEGAEVTVYARESGYSLGIVKGTTVGGWMNSQYLVELGAYTAPSSGKAPSNGNADKLVAQGLSYELGDGEKQDFIKAEEYYKKAIELGSTEAMARLAMLYLKDGYTVDGESIYDGRLSPVLFDPDEITDPLELLLKAAEADDPTAMQILGEIACYQEGFTEYSFNTGTNWVDIQFSNPYLCPGVLFENYLAYSDLNYEDVKSEHGLLTASEYLKRACSFGNKEALTMLAEYCFYTLNTEDSDEAERTEAMEWLKNRAAGNDPYSLYLLARLSEEEEASNYYSLAEKAAIKQNDAKVMTILAFEKLPWEEDEPVKADFSEAVTLFKKAAKAGDSGTILGIVTGLDRYFEDYYEGLTNKFAYQTTKEFIKTAFSKCSAVDLAYMGYRMHFEGDLFLVNDDDETAPERAVLCLECSLAAAEKGNIGALQELSCVLLCEGFEYLRDSVFITKSFSKRAFKVILEAAENNIFPMSAAGDPIVWMYENGYGTKMDEEKAEYWGERIEKYWFEEEAKND